MTFPYTDFVLCTEHSHAFHAPDFCGFDLHRITGFRINSGSHGCYNYFLARRHIGCTAYDLEGFPSADIYLGYFEFICIRMRFG